MYHPVEYWSKRQEPNDRKDVPEYVANYFRKHLQGETLLDFGPGVGRMFHLYKGFEVTGIDIVDTYRDRALDRAVELGLDYSYMQASPKYFKTNEFDCCVASKVLLHVEPEEIQRTLDVLGRVSKRVIVWDMQCEEPEPHNFSHDYKKMVDMKHVVTNGNDLLFYYER